MIPEVIAPTIKEALEMVDIEGDEYAFRNSWLVDVDGRIKHFTYQDKSLIAKRSVVEKATEEVENAQRAYNRLAGKHLGVRALKVIVPEIVLIDRDPSQCYLVSEYVGVDMNECYYQQDDTKLGCDEFARLVNGFSYGGIQSNGLLPRNTIVTPTDINIIDWERIKTLDKPCAPDRVAWTNMAISWSYFFGLQNMENIKESLLEVNTEEPSTSGFEERFFKFIGGNKFTHEQEACMVAKKAEAYRGNERLDYKIDDIFHVIGELMPSNIEVLMDLLLSGCDDTDHCLISSLLAAIYEPLQVSRFHHEVTDQIKVFTKRCARIALLLVDNQIPTEISNKLLGVIDNVQYSHNIMGLADDIGLAVIRSYPEAKPRWDILMQTAQDIKDCL